MRTKNNLLAAGVLLAALATGFAQPVITMQPQSQTNVVGSTLTLAVEATGTPPLYYQWRKGSVTVAGETNTTLIFMNLQSSHAGNYTVVITNAEGAVTSSVALLRVLLPVAITSQPASRKVGLCANVTFSVTASGTAPLRYQWRRNESDLAGRTNNTLVLANVQATNAGDYSVVVANAAGPITSDVGILTVDPALTAYTGVYVFGHSWSDTQITAHSCNTTGASSNYWQGRYSNGPMWPEFLCTSLGLDYVAANNRAICAAQTADVLNQVIAFPAPPMPELGLFFVMAGASDFAFNLNNLTDDAIWNGRIQTWVNANTNAVLRLYAKGARDIVVQNCHDLSLSPAQVGSMGSNSPDQLLLRQRITSFNASLAAAMENLSGNISDMRLHLVDNFSELNAVVANPATYGLTKTYPDAVTDPTLADKSVTGPGADYVYWDPRHPTSKVHRLISDWHLEVLTTAAPERLQLIADGVMLDVAMQKLRGCRQYGLQSSTNLVDWQDAATFIARAGTNQLSLPFPAESATFYRLRWGR